MKGWGILIAKTLGWINQSYYRHPGDWGAVAEDVLPKVLGVLALAFILGVIFAILAWLWEKITGKTNGKPPPIKKDGQCSPPESAPVAEGSREPQEKTIEAGIRNREGGAFARALGNIRRTFFRKLPRNLWLFVQDVALGWWGEFVRYASFKGRTTRWKFLVFILINAAIFRFLAGMPLWMAVAVLALPILAACSRRLNDSCTSPWMVFAVPLLPLLLLAPTAASGDALPGKSAWDRVVWNVWRLVKEACGKWWGGIAKYASFRGKMTRGDFLAYYAMQHIVVLAIEILADCWPPLRFAELLFVLPTFAAIARRLNDTDISPWFCLLILVPFIVPWGFPLDDPLLILLLVPAVEAKDSASSGERHGTSPGNLLPQGNDNLDERQPTT